MFVSVTCIFHFLFSCYFLLWGKEQYFVMCGIIISIGNMDLMDGALSQSDLRVITNLIIFRYL